jgi:hypothetical protein
MTRMNERLRSKESVKPKIRPQSVMPRRISHNKKHNFKAV